MDRKVTRKAKMYLELGPIPFLSFGFYKMIKGFIDSTFASHFRA